LSAENRRSFVVTGEEEAYGKKWKKLLQKKKVCGNKTWVIVMGMGSSSSV
jgi:hypothetical protein